MAAFDVPTDATLSFFRTSADPAYLARIQAEAAIERQHNERVVGFLVIGIILIGVFALLYGIQRRRQIAGALDNATIASLAVGVRTRRRLRAKLDTFRARVIEKADEPSSPKS